MELFSKMIWLFFVASLANFARVTGNSTSIILSPAVTTTVSSTVTSTESPAVTTTVNSTVTSTESPAVTTTVSSTVTSTESPAVTATESPTVTVTESPAVTANERPTVAATPTRTSIPLASTTTTPAPIKPVKPIPSDAKQFKGEVALTDSFNEKLTDKNSQEFKDLANKVTKALEDVYRSISGFLKILIDAFKPGSTVVEFRVIFQSNATVTEEEAAKSIKDAVTGGNLGGLTVDENSVKVSQVSESTKETPTTDTDSMQQSLFALMLAGVIVVGLVLVLLIVVVILLAKLWREGKANQHRPPMY